MVWGEVSLTHPTSHARLAIWEMVKGRYKTEFWTGMVLSLVGGLLPLLTELNVLDISLGVGGAPLAASFDAGTGGRQYSRVFTLPSDHSTTVAAATFCAPR